MMIFKSYIFFFRPGDLIYLCMRISNSVVGVGLYYGFLTTFSIGPSYLFSLRALAMEEGEEGNEKKVAATTGFLVGQLMMFISIYYAPLHIALGRPHTITVLALPYLLFHFFWNNHKDFFDYGSTNRNSMRNLNIQCVFLNNLIFQLFNHFILPSSMLARLVNVYMFRCNNKILFVTSSLVGWLIGQILFIKWVGLVLVWIQQNHSIRSNVLIRSKFRLVLVWIQQKSSIRFNVLIRSNKYLASLAYQYKYLVSKLRSIVSELRNSMARIFSTFLFITCIYYLGRIPSPILTKQLKGTSEMEEIEKKVSARRGTKTKEEEEVFTEEDPSPSLFSEEREDPDKIDEREEIRVNGKKKKKRKDELLTLLFDSWVENSLVILLFDSNKWNRPFRYIKNNQFQNAVKNEMSQYFFYTCQSDGKERISFMYPPSLSTFKEIIEKKISFFTTEKLLSDQLYNDCNLTNDLKRLNKTDEFINRVRTLDKESFDIGIFEQKTQLCNDETKKEYFPKKNDPFLYGPYRGRIKKGFSPPSINQIYKKKKMGEFWINKIHALLLTNDYRELKQTIDKLNNSRSLLTKKKLSLFRFREPKHQTIHSNVVITKSSDQRSRKRSIEIKEISKKVPRWPYYLLDDLQLEEGETGEERVELDSQIRLRKYKYMVIFDDSEDSNEPDPAGEIAWIRYLPYSDFRRNLIKGSMRAQRRKTVTCQLFYQAKAHSPLFVDRIDRRLFSFLDRIDRGLFSFLNRIDRRLFSFDSFGRMKGIFQNLMSKKSKKLQISDYTKEKRKVEKYQDEERMRMEIAEAWDTITYAQAVRGFLLVGQSILRKYIRLPLLIIAKNIARIFLFQGPEWSEDFKDWNREMHIRCTYNGVELSDKEFPKNWLTDGIQIKILFPFYLKPWHRSKLKPLKTQKAQKNDFCFLTIFGPETDHPFGPPRKLKGSSFFEPIFKELKKKVKKLKKKSFIVFNVFKERAKFLRKVSKEIKKWSIKNYELGETKTDDSIMNNQMIRESPIQIRSTEWTNFSLTEKKMKDLTERTSTINKKLERILNEKKNGFLTQEKNMNSNKKSYHNKILESLKKFCQILKRRNTRLIRKFDFFIKFFMEKIYIDFFLCIINIARTNAQLFIESRKKMIEKSISNKKENEKRIKKRNTKKFHFILTKKNSLDNIQNKNSTTFCNSSSFSQAYVFYKISQTRVINFYKFKSILQYHGTSLFLKNEIKDFFRKEGIFHSGLRHKDFWHSERNQWKNWLRGHYQYDFSQIIWLKLVPEKWRNKVNRHCMTQKNDFNKWGSYEKEGLIHDEKQNDFEPDSLLNQESKKSSNFKKHHRHDFFSYKSINYEEKKDSYIYRSPLQINSKEDIFDNYKIDKRKFFDMPDGLPIYNYLGENDIMAEEKFPDRKFCRWKMIDFCLRNNKVEIHYWANSGTKNKNQKMKRGPFSLPIYQNSKINPFKKKKDPSLTKKKDPSLTKKKDPFLTKKKRSFFDWMEMNEEIVGRISSNPELELWFFPEFVPLYNAYKIQPGIIPIKLLLFNFHLNGNKNIKKNITESNPLIESKKKKRILRFENRNQEEKDPLNQGEGAPLSDENGGRSGIKKQRRKKKANMSPEAIELYSFLESFFYFQLSWERVLNKKMVNNIRAYCLLLRLINPKDVAISYLKRGELTVDIWTLKRHTPRELSTSGTLIIEPTYPYPSIKNDGQLILYQTIGIFLVHKNKYLHKNKYQRNQKFREWFDKNQFDESILRHQKMTQNRDKNHYDFFVPETILSPKGRRELRILYFLNSRDRNDIHRNPVFCNQVKNCGQVLNRGKYLGIDKNKLIKMKFFLWPNYRLEDLACMNRYWFNTHNGSRFSMVRIHMYPRLKIC
uniref:Protein TIC 214 n=2 Tax=Daphne TaxID=66679 RepID=A0A4Y5MXY0_9ROSI|nr:Ycf1 [Daphne tangutica]YP_009663884.1 Ycf1 [Daphne tangutica]QCW07899.1 Ycf1 [Daphne tangutica]QCW07917.1 Ycf1 [Daphne tangutica]